MPQILRGCSLPFYCTLLFILFFANSEAQNPDIKRTYHWYFGNKAGLDFSNGTPVPITNSAMTAEEGCSSISDTCGNLLFYTDGDTIWNKYHLPMPNGLGLMGCWSSTQSSLIIPQPGNDSLYYIFTTDCAENIQENGLRYSIVNINLDNGSGDVISKNNLLHKPAFEKLAGTYHANGTDIWILSTNAYPIGPAPDTTYQYFSYLLNSSGVSQPVISASAIHPHKTRDEYLRFSHDGKKVVNAWHSFNDTLELLDFNKNTGKVLNPIILIPDSIGVSYGVVFSPDDSKLYASTFNEDDTCYVVQFDLSSGIPDTIIASRAIIQHGDINTNSFWAMQTGSGDGKIYIVRNRQNNSFLDVISNPNLAGASCNYIKDGINLGTGNCIAGLPNFVDSYLSGIWSPGCNSGIPDITYNVSLNVYPNPFSSFAIIEIINNKNIDYEICLLDITGNEVRKIKTKKSSLLLSRDDLPEGIYLLRLSSSQNCLTRKIIIIN